MELPGLPYRLYGSYRDMMVSEAKREEAIIAANSCTQGAVRPHSTVFIRATAVENIHRLKVMIKERWYQKFGYNATSSQQIDSFLSVLDCDALLQKTITDVFSSRSQLDASVSLSALNDKVVERVCEHLAISAMNTLTATNQYRNMHMPMIFDSSTAPSIGKKQSYTAERAPYDQGLGKAICARGGL
jgi:hypothetical protein